MEEKGGMPNKMRMPAEPSFHPYIDLDWQGRPGIEAFAMPDIGMLCI